MAIIQTPTQYLFQSSFLMNRITHKTLLSFPYFRHFSASSTDLRNTHEVVHGVRSLKVKSRVSDAQLKENWLSSLSSPLMEHTHLRVEAEEPSGEEGSTWVLGIDPDCSGAIGVLKCDKSGISAQVFDTPRVKIPIGKRVRNRLDARSIVQLLQSFQAPLGTTAYIEQSIPFPKDGKQGWWSGGFGYGLWIGILVASGFSVVPVSSLLWKNHFNLSKSSPNKDDSRNVASVLFPSLSSLLKRKMDHGRAEALLIAAYGKGLSLQSEPCREERGEPTSTSLLNGLADAASTIREMESLELLECSVSNIIQVQA